MNLVIDIGNTRSKYAFFQEDRLIGVNYRLDSILEDIRVWKEKGEKVWIFLTGSGHIDSEMQLAIKEQADYWLEASPALEVPLKIGYATPETLGFDRIAICVGAKSYYPGASLLVIDSGTCITYNYVSAEGVFLGGNISPGLEMRFNGLHRFTARLPLVTPTETYGGIGQSTEEAIRNGVMSGMLFEVQQYIERFLGQYPEGHVLITGGNAHFLERHLTPDILFCKYLSFVGLNEILKYVKKSNY